MITIAYLANQFPSPLEPYVAEEILELRRRGVRVLPGSARLPDGLCSDGLKKLSAETAYLQLPAPRSWPRICWLCICHPLVLLAFARRALYWRKEPLGRKLRALAHTWLGVCYAARLSGQGARHIHVHHGYFSAWIAMVAARLLGIGFSMTLHGSDVLRDAAYLDVKLEASEFCVTISDFNRNYILHRYPEIPSEKIVVCRLGVDVPLDGSVPSRACQAPFLLLAVGRLHAVKDHAFLVRACRLLRDRGLPLLCMIAGDGPERNSLERLIEDLELQSSVRLLGHLPPPELAACYRSCDLVALTSRSEGIPVALMEAMSHSRPVLAPAITGIPELVLHGWNGFLYRPGSIADFVAQADRIYRSRPELTPVCRRARQHVLRRFNREQNLGAFAATLLSRLITPPEKGRNEDLVLQQI